MLNEQQQKVLLSKGVSLGNIAGPGSGKTRTLTEKISYIAKEEGIESIKKTLVLTFTNSAADEIKSRALNSLSQLSSLNNLYFGTFHSTFKKIIIKEDGFSQIGFNHNPTIFTPNELQRVFLTLSLSYLEKNQKTLVSFISTNFLNDKPLNRTALKKEIFDTNVVLSEVDFIINRLTKKNIENLSSFEQLNEYIINKSLNRMMKKFENIPNPSLNEDEDMKTSSLFGRGLITAYFNNEISLEEISKLLESILNKFSTTKLEQNVFSFSDIMTSTLFVLVKRPAVTNEIKNFFKYIFVDEYQDTNTIQKEILKLIYNKNNICVIGDPYQSIYSFLGADINNILNSETDFNAKIIQLIHNYRSNENIVSLTNYIATNMVRKLDSWKPCVSSGKKTNNLIHIYRDTEDREQRKKLIEIIDRKKLGETIGIINRTGKDFLTESFLTNSNYNYTKLGGISLKESVEVQTLIHLINFTLYPHKKLSFSFILDKIEGIGAASIIKFQNGEFDNKKLPAKFLNVEKNIEELRNELLESNNDIPSFIKTINSFFYKFLFPKISKPWKYDRIEEANMKLEVIFDEAMEKVNILELESFLSEYLLSDNSNKDKDKNTITLTTIHSAKGLEWDHVILMDWSSNSFKRDEEDEAQRLNYVSVSRAIENLTIFSTEDIFDIPSSFINSKPGLFKSHTSKQPESKAVRFGKHKGQSFDSLPRNYLFWLWEEQYTLKQRNLLTSFDLSIIKDILDL